MSPSATPEPYVLTITGEATGLSWRSLVELWHFREVLAAFVMRHVKVKYKQAAIGIGWALIQPIVSATLFAIFLGRFVHIPSDGSPYFLLALSGMVCWTYFSTASGSAMDSLVADQGLLRKVYFPREVLPFASVAAAVMDLGIAVLLLAAFAIGFGMRPSPAWLLLPIPMLLLVISAAAVGGGLSALNVYYRDIRYALPFVLQLGLFASPVVFSVSAIPPAWRLAYMTVNPVASAIDGVRRIVLHGEAPALAPTVGAYVCALALFVLGYMLFKRFERSFSDRV